MVFLRFMLLVWLVHVVPQFPYEGWRHFEEQAARLRDRRPLAAAAPKATGELSGLAVAVAAPFRLPSFFSHSVGLVPVFLSATLTESLRCGR